MILTNAERLTAAMTARELVSDAIARLDCALSDVERVVGREHDASKAVAISLTQAKIAGVKLDLLAKRIPR